MAAARALRYNPRVPIPENRRSIERALAEQRRNGMRPGDGKRRKLARMAARLAEMRRTMAPERFARVHEQFLEAAQRIGFQMRNRKRRDDGSMPALVEPPRGPKPFAGGAAAPLEFD